MDNKLLKVCTLSWFIYQYTIAYIRNNNSNCLV